MIPKNVYDLCKGDLSVTSELAQNPALAPHEACKKLFGIDTDDEVVTKKLHLSAEGVSDLDQARACGRWGNSNPSDLFLKVRLSPKVVMTRTDD